MIALAMPRPARRAHTMPVARTTSLTSLALRIAEAFDLGGRVVAVRPYGNGLINDTFLVSVAAAHGPRHAILQRLNRHVFPQPERIMQNLRTLHAHLAPRLRPSPGELRFASMLYTREGADYFLDAEGGFWRAQTFIERTRTYSRLCDPRHAIEMGFALGRFHALTFDLDPARLYVTRPGFHDTPRYLARFDEVLAQGRIVSSAAAGEMLEECLAFVEEHKGMADLLEQARRSGALALRVIHGDPKLDNVLFDEETGRAVGLIDLDTVQPGLLLYDLGDCLRSCCNPAGESPRDPAQAHFDLDICRALLARYFDEIRDRLTPADYRYLPEAVRLIPFELGVRFLTDYLEGNPYFKVEWPEHNLLRATVQFRLAASMARQEPQLRALINELAGSNAKGT